MVLLTADAGCWRRAGDESRGTSPQLTESVEFSNELERILVRKLELIEELAHQPEIVQAARDANRSNAPLSEQEIKRLDQQWVQSQGLNDLIKSIITNRTADILVDFQEQHGEFIEIMLTDEQGLIIAATNRTSDYYQKDESWWNRAYDEGRGRSYHGPIEFDESTNSESISMNVPVRDPDNEHVIGVIKAVCDITAIKMEL
ncbi:MAG: PDC sensor domain-containing protein [Planctomycetes bacterium]|nr:PDC sensor domain-containing protein [Planctomycetota bacterium]